MTREINHSLVISRVVGNILDPFTGTVKIRIFSNGKYVFNGSWLRPSQILTRLKIHFGGCDYLDFRHFIHS